MGKILEELDSVSQQFILKQKVFFVATAPDQGKVNLSPKGTDSFRILSSKRVVWLNLTGSGNETAAHLLENNRITIMFCAFEDKPNILRIYGTAKSIYEKDVEWKELISLFPPLPGKRQIIDVSIHHVKNTCGMGVPIMKFEQERVELITWAEKKGDKKIKEYWEEKNKISLDGKPTGM